MSGTNDSLIIGCVLVLVFGALFYYLHSRLSYSEKRINVMETILLDFKNASESFFAPQQQGVVADEEVEPNTDASSLPQPFTVTSSHVSSTTIAGASVSPETSPQSSEEQPSQILRNYESMNIKELQQEARNRNISGISGLRRKELIAALRDSDNETVQRPTVVEELTSPQSSITETAAEIVDSSLSPN